MKPIGRRKLAILKVLALLSQIRWYNVLLLGIGQYLAAIYVFSKPAERIATFSDPGTHLTIWAAAFILGFGFLINSFYDIEADTINRPKQTAFERLVSKTTSLRLALVFLTIGLFMSYSVSWRALSFYLIYAIGLWFYSHKLRGIPMLGHVAAALLALLPFFGIAVYHHYLSLHTILFGVLLGHTLFSREVLKDLLMFKGDTVVGKHTFASEFGLENTRKALLVNTALVWLPAFFVRPYFSEHATWGIFSILVVLTIANITALISNDIKGLRWAHLGYKVVLILGVLTIPFL